MGAVDLISPFLNMGKVMILLSNQILQRTIHEIGGITGCGCAVWNMEGSCLATSAVPGQRTAKEAEAFISQIREDADISEKIDAEYALFLISEELEPVYVLTLEKGDTTTDLSICGRLAVSQLEGLIRVCRERMDKNRFMQNLILDNLLLVDIYNQAKKLGIQVEKRRIVFLLEPKNPEDNIVLDMIKGIYATGSGDFVTAVDEGHVILIKSLEETEDYPEAGHISEMLVDVVNTEAMMNVRVAYGTIINELKDVSQSYKEAGMALDVGRIFYPEKSVLAYKELGIGRLIHQLPVTLCEMFLEEVFAGKAVSQFDEETLTTVDKFFENNLNISETARKLFVHRNTLVYRLEKIQKQTGLDVRVFEDALTFKIALMVADHMKFVRLKE